MCGFYSLLKNAPKHRASAARCADRTRLQAIASSLCTKTVLRCMRTVFQQSVSPAMMGGIRQSGYLPKLTFDKVQRFSSLENALNVMRGHAPNAMWVCACAPPLRRRWPVESLRPGRITTQAPSLSRGRGRRDVCPDSGAVKDGIYDSVSGRHDARCDLFLDHDGDFFPGI